MSLGKASDLNSLGKARNSKSSDTFDFLTHSCVIRSCFLSREGQRPGEGQTFFWIWEISSQASMFFVEEWRKLVVVWTSSNWRRPLDFTPFSITLHPNTISKASETKPTVFPRDTDETRKRSSF